MESNESSEHTMMIADGTPLIAQIDPKKARFPCCLVWTPLPVLSWLVPFIGHVGICREDGVILDFAGPNFVCVDNFTFGAVARYVQISKDKALAYEKYQNTEPFMVLDSLNKISNIQYWFQCCNLPRTDLRVNEDDVYEREESGSGILIWDDALRKSTQEFQHRAYNLLTCNCHSFVANNLNRLGFHAGGWNVVNVAIILFLKGQWVDTASMVRSYLPFFIVFILGITFGGWAFFTFLSAFAFILVGWFLLGSYCLRNIIQL